MGDDRHALKHMKEGSSIVNTTSVTAYKGSPKLLDYSATKGAIVSFTRGLALQLVGRGIRVNGVAPGPIWTPLIPASFDEEETQKFGSEVPMKRAGQPIEVAPCYVFLASNADSSYITGQVLHPNGTNPFSFPSGCGMNNILDTSNGNFQIVQWKLLGYIQIRISVRKRKQKHKSDFVYGNLLK